MRAGEGDEIPLPPAEISAGQSRLQLLDGNPRISKTVSQSLAFFFSEGDLSWLSGFAHLWVLRRTFSTTNPFLNRASEGALDNVRLIFRGLVAFVSWQLPATREQLHSRICRRARTSAACSATVMKRCGREERNPPSFIRALAISGRMRRSYVFTR